MKTSKEVTRVVDISNEYYIFVDKEDYSEGKQYKVVFSIKEEEYALSSMMDKVKKRPEHLRDLGIFYSMLGACIGVHEELQKYKVVRISDSYPIDNYFVIPVE